MDPGSGFLWFGYRNGIVSTLLYDLEVFEVASITWSIEEVVWSLKIFVIVFFPNTSTKYNNRYTTIEKRWLEDRMLILN